MVAGLISLALIAMVTCGCRTQAGRDAADIVTQVLDYGSWVRTLRAEDTRPSSTSTESTAIQTSPASIDTAFCKRFGLKAMPEELNERHELVIVGSSFDPDTERIVTYLTDAYGVDINAVFFRVFSDGDRQYLTRAWMREPESLSSAASPSMTPTRSSSSPKGDWNGEYYVSFGDTENDGRSWKDAVKYGFISGGGGEFYIKTLSMLSPGDRVWVNIPGEGYVGVGEVTSPVVRVDQFMVPGPDGVKVPITKVADLTAPDRAKPRNIRSSRTPVGVRWTARSRATEQSKKGILWESNTVARPRDAKWVYTVDRLKERFGLKRGSQRRAITLVRWLLLRCSDTEGGLGRLAVAPGVHLGGGAVLVEDDDAAGGGADGGGMGDFQEFQGLAGFGEFFVGFLALDEEDQAALGPGEGGPGEFGEDGEAADGRGR